MMEMMTLPPPVAADVLRDNLANLSDRDQSFAKSLLDQLRSRGTLSQKQWPWVQKLADRATGANRVEENIGDLSKLVGIFDTAKGKLKWPKIHIQSPVGMVKLSVAGERARVPGSINVVLDGEWVGRIHRDGRFEARTKIDGLADFLSNFAADPAGKAAQHGHASGNCCFCRKELTDARSLEAGFGPVCAANFGLNWGSHIREKGE